QARVRDFLVWTANRTWLDHWYDEKPLAKPYFQEIVSRLLGDADKLFPALREEHRQLRERLSAPGRLQLDGPERLVLTSEFEAPAGFRVAESGAAKVPAGIPVVRPHPDPLLQLAEGATEFRVAPREPNATIGVRLTSPMLREAEQDLAGGDPRF